MERTIKWIDFDCSPLEAVAALKTVVNERPPATLVEVSADDVLQAAADWRPLFGALPLGTNAEEIAISPEFTADYLQASVHFDGDSRIDVGPFEDVWGLGSAERALVAPVSAPRGVIYIGDLNPAEVYSALYHATRAKKQGNPIQLKTRIDTVESVNSNVRTRLGDEMMEKPYRDFVNQELEIHLFEQQGVLYCMDLDARYPGLPAAVVSKLREHTIERNSQKAKIGIGVSSALGVASGIGMGSIEIFELGTLEATLAALCPWTLCASLVTVALCGSYLAIRRP